jgi:hypothetical protein
MANNWIARALKRIGNAIIDVTLKALIVSVGLVILGVIGVIWIALKGNPHGPWFYAAAGVLACAVIILLTMAVLIAIKLSRKTVEPASPITPESGKTEVEQTLIQSNAQLANLEQKFRVLQSRDDEFKWLHEAIKNQQQAIQSWVYLDNCSVGAHDLFRSAPYIEFRFSIRNWSVYTLSFGPLSGTVAFAGSPLIGKVEWIKPVKDVYPGAGRPFLENDCFIRLTLEEKRDVARILNIDSGFGFQELVATISASQEGVDPQGLSFGCGVDNRKLSEDGKYKRLEIELHVCQLWRYLKFLPSQISVGEFFPLDEAGSIVNLNVRLTNRRDEPIEVSSFTLDTSSVTGTRRTSARTGAIFERPATGTGSERANRGVPLEPNLNEFPFQAEPGTPHWGWLQFIILDVTPEQLLGSTPTLIATDSQGVEHRLGCPSLVLSQD